MKIPANLLPAIILLSVPIAFQATSWAQEEPAPRTQEDATHAFLVHKQQLQIRRAQSIPDAANLRELNGIVRALGFPPPRPNFISDPATLSTLNNSLIVDIAQMLAERGFKAGDLRNSNGQANLAATAAANHIRGSSTLSDEVYLSDTVIIGRVVGTNSSEDLGDGFRSTVLIKIDQTAKGSFAPGQIVKVRRVSGIIGDKGFSDSSEEPFAEGTQVALLGSAALYQTSARAGRPCRECVREQVPMFRVEGESLLPTGGARITGNLSTLRGK